MATPDRQELIRNAVSFLVDPKAQAAPLAQRVQFLEAKGLTGPEIEEAMRQAAANHTAPQAYGPSAYSPTYGPMPYNAIQPLPPQWDWRDYFITAVVSGTIAYGAAALFRKYVSPHLKPPSATAYEQDKDAMTAQFDAAEALLKEIQAETTAVRAAVEEQNEKVAKVTKEVDSVVKDMRDGEARTRDEMREIREEVNNVREMLPKMIEKNKESHNQSLAELQQELKSLKALLLSRGPGISTGPSTPILPGKPSIPAWQLAGGLASQVSTPSTPPPSVISPNSPLQSPTTENPLAGSVTARTTSSSPPPISSNAPAVSKDGEEATPAKEDNPPPVEASALAPSVEPPSSVAESAPGSQDDTIVAEVVSAPQAQENGVEVDEAISASAVTQESSTPAQPVSENSPFPPAEESEASDIGSPLGVPSDAQDAPVEVSAEAGPAVDLLADEPLAEDPLSTANGNAAAEAPANVVNGGKPLEPAISVEEVLEIRSETPRPATPNGKISDGVDVEALQKRLKLVEQRFTDVSTSFKRLQAEKLAADRVLRELTSVESVTEVDALRDFLQNMSFKTEMAQDEIRRLTGKLTRQDERIEELRDIHRLESKSQIDQIDQLKAQVEEAEKLLKASQSSTAQAEQESAKRKAEIDKLQSELDKAKNDAKEEEEKRTKAIALLKTVRQKLVKAEKERDDAVKEVNTLKETEKGEREKEKAERAKLQAEIQKVNEEREMAVQGLRAQFDREVTALKEKHEKELATLRGQYELEAITAKTTHVREIENKKSRIADLESTVRALSREKDELFDQVQLRQAELESSQSLLESLQGQNTELQFQLREANDRVALLQEEFSDIRHEQDMKVASSGPSAEEITRLLAAAESKYETKLSDLRKRLAEAERERDEGEARWSKTLTERAREVELLKAQISSSQQSKDEENQGVQALEKEIESLKSEIRSYQMQITDLHSQLQKAAEVEATAKDQLAELSAKTANLQQFADESKNREAQLRSQNKTLREELRKVQSSVALLEKQRGPGVGYWASRNESTSELRSPTSSVSELPSRETPERAGTPSAQSSDEEVNFEYLRNVILQFLEHKEMRPHLVRILSTILRFTPQETRRLIAKV
ncbi:peroxisomal membrane anchor protein conserved region-domain-containing protein [Dichomitus squalens]|uniref:Peroxisomal membrane protein PEX14 n=1 Tax=Dichomitus squalens TaxID=114155 RepID=A0A4Q9N233_9APHY|nr:peroxisomal membrane anchor protein conserved region-domain-containing protein [Dichomitus squalens]